MEVQNRTTITSHEQSGPAQVPAVSICMAAYNAEAYLHETLDSIQAQTFRDFELVFVDDGSTDQTLAIAREYAARDSRIRVFAQEMNRGLIVTRNRTLREARAALIAISDSDDCMHPERLQRQVDFFDAHAEVGVLGAAVKFLSNQGRGEPTQALYLDDPSIRFFLRLLPCLWNTTTMYRRELLDEHDVYREQFTAGAEDYDLWSRLLPKTKFANLPETLMTVRLHGLSVSATQTKCLANVLTVSKRLLNEYGGLKLTDEERLMLHRFMIFMGLPQAAVERALEILEALRAKARDAEPPGVYSTFCQQLGKIYLTHSEYMSYVSPATSRKLLAKVCSTRRSYLRTARFWKQAVRCQLVNRVHRPKLAATRRDA